MSNDRIEKRVHLRAPRERVWNAIANAEQFGSWFGVKLAGPFHAGQQVTAELTMPEYAGMTFEMWVEAVEPQSRFAYRWHPGMPGEGEDFSDEPTTLVEFFLEDADGGTALTVVETGFDALPLARRAAAFEDNTGGWDFQAEAIKAYVEA